MGQPHAGGYIIRVPSGHSIRQAAEYKIYL